MSVALDARKIVLRGDCPIEDAEPLLVILQNHADHPVDMEDATNVHAAVLQILLAFKRDLIGGSRDSFLQEWIVPVLAGHFESLI